MSRTDATRIMCDLESHPSRLALSLSNAQVIRELMPGDRVRPGRDSRLALAGQPADGGDRADECFVGDVIHVGRLWPELHADEPVHRVQMQLQQCVERAAVTDLASDARLSCSSPCVLGLVVCRHQLDTADVH